MKAKSSPSNDPQEFYLLDGRPGDFDGNLKALLSCVRQGAQDGLRKMVFASDTLRGGDCGSLAGHPLLLEAEAKAIRRFRKALAKIRHAPEIEFSDEVGTEDLRSVWPATVTPFGMHPQIVFETQVEGLARRLESIGCRSVVLGLSGGLDSSLALLVAAAAFDRLGLDRKGIRLFTMPGFGTTKRTKGNAGLLAEGLGIPLETIDITPACRQHFRDIGHDERVHDIVFENTQARERTQILMDKANQLGGIVLGTGDMSEIALGWSTYNGDHMSMFGVNAGVPKTVVRKVCAWWADERSKNETAGCPAKAAKALRDIIATPVSPELLPAKEGKIAQKTEDHVGPYELHDFFLWKFLVEEKTESEILADARRAFRGTYDAATIRRWLDVFFRRFFSQAFKRNCAPDGIPVFPVYLSPRGQWVPSDMVRPK